MNMEKITDGLMKVSSVIQENKYIGAISDGLLMTMPLMIVGAIGSIVNSLGIPAWQEFLTSSGLKHITALPNEIGTNMFALFAVFAIGCRFAKGENKDGMTAGILSLMSFMMVTPLEFNEAGAMAAIPAEWLGAAGLFVAMLMGLVAAKVYCTFIEKKIVIKMPPGVPPVIERSFASILPALSVAFLSLLLAFVFALTPFNSLHGFVYQIIAKPLSGLSGTFPALLIAVLFTHVMWSIGIHGTMIALTVFYPIWAALDMQNLAAYNAGEPAPYIVSMQFFFLCAFAGGAGNTIGLVLNMFTSKNEVNRTLAKLAIVPGLFGINEPIIFGMPIVLNPIMIIPFIVCPAVTTVLAYLACTMGVIASPTGISAIAGAPIVVSQFLQGGVTWAVWMVIEIVLSFVIYRPFFKMYEKRQLAEQSEEEQQKNLGKISEGFEQMTK